MIRNKKIIKEVMERDIGLCQCCGFKADEVHHIVPLSMGGLDDISNMVSICGFCHKNSPNTKEEFEEYKKHGGAKLPYLIGQAMLKSDGNDFHIIMTIIKQFRQVDITHALETYKI